MKRVVLLLLVASLASACAYRGPPPLIATGRDARYPHDRYVVGIGEGFSLEDARRRAVASIASQLRSTLRSSDALSAEARRSVDDGGRSGSYEEALRREIHVETSFDRPEWIEVVETHREGSKVQVACVLDRARARAQLEAELAVAVGALRVLLERSDSLADLRQLSEHVAELRRKRDELHPSVAMLAALAPGRSTPPPELAAVETVAARLQDERRALVLRACVQPVAGSELASSRFVARLAAHATVVGCEATEATWTLEARLETVTETPPPTPGAYRHFCSARIDWRVRDATGSLLHGGIDGGRETRRGGSDLPAACRDSVEALVSNVAEKLGLAGDAP